MMLRRALLLVSLTVWAAGAAPQPTVELELSSPAGVIATLRGTAPSRQDAGRLPAGLDAAAAWSVVEAKPATGCGPIRVTAPRGPFALVVQRGGCEFRVKVQNAGKTGASAVIITDSIASFYDFSGGDPRLKPEEGGPCLLRCDLGEGEVPLPVARADLLAGLPGSACAKSPSCPSGLCGVSGQRTGPKAFRACCLPDKAVQMDLGNATSPPPLPAVFLGAAPAARLAQAMRDSRSLTLRMADPGPGFGWLLSAVMIWVLGCGVEALATWCSAHAERAWVATGGAPLSPTRRHREEEAVEMTVGTAICYLGVASVGLVVLFLLVQKDPRAVVFLMIGVFSLATLSVVTSLGTYPVLCRVAPDLDKGLLTVPCLGSFSLAWALGYAISFATVVFWVVNRHASYAWVLQDTFAIFVCCQFVQSLRMNSIKVSTVLLVSFMVYDIFMVFLSPLIFKSSVMVTVAQAGTGSVSISKLNPLECVRIPDERMPMLFMLPRFGAEGEYAMLGLGDVLLPGLLLSFMLRYDTLARRNLPPLSGCFSVCHLCHRYTYWTLGVVGYVVGLFLAFLANTLGFTILDVKGQPALLYLVPCTLAPLTALALLRGELADMWAGPAVLQPQGRPSAEGFRSHTPC